MLACCFGLLHLGFHVQQELFHFPGPALLEFFFHEGEFAQMMHVAPGVGEAVAPIAAEAIMDAGATKLGSNANGVERRTSSARMSCVVGELIRRADMDPPAYFADAQPRFILVDHVRLHQSRLEAGFHFGQLPMAGVDKGSDAARREPDSQEILQQLARTSVGHRLAFH